MYEHKHGFHWCLTSFWIKKTSLKQKTFWEKERKTKKEVNLRCNWPLGFANSIPTNNITLLKTFLPICQKLTSNWLQN